MSESPTPAAPRPGPPRPAAEQLRALETLEERPLAEHVAVLTAAHDALAAQLSAAER